MFNSYLQFPEALRIESILRQAVSRLASDPRAEKKSQELALWIGLASSQWGLIYIYIYI